MERPIGGRALDDEKYLVVPQAAILVLVRGRDPLEELEAELPEEP